MTHDAKLITLDFFGTVLDWRAGLTESCRAAGRPLRDREFDRIIDAQAALEQGCYLDYSTITRRSLVEVIGLADATAQEIASQLGRWPLYADAQALRALMTIVPCAAMTNSDRSHGKDIQAQLGFSLDDWLCAEDTRVYKPNPEFWQQMSCRRRIDPGRHWWHVSAYADYDLEVAKRLGLTTVFVHRPHARPGDATYAVRDLHGLWSCYRRRSSKSGEATAAPARTYPRMGISALSFIEDGLSALERSLHDRDAALRHVQLATLSPSGPPGLRTLILRAFERVPASAEMHTDARAGKARDIAHAGGVTLLAWSSADRLQIRLEGSARLHRNDDVARDRWHKLSPRARGPYGLRAAPGAAIAHPEDQTHLPEEEQFAQFAVILVSLARVDVLRLAEDGGQTRAAGCFTASGIAANWASP